jgi:hypothetical protein
MMRHVCDYGVREAPLEGGAFKMRPHRRRKALASLLDVATRTRPQAPLEGGAFKMRPRRRRKALASLLGVATRTRPQARLGASPKQWLSLARTGNAALHPSADIAKGGERRPQAAANAKTRVCGVARLAPIDIGAALRALHPSRLERNALRVSSC